MWHYPQVLLSLRQVHAGLASPRTVLWLAWTADTRRNTSATWLFLHLLVINSRSMNSLWIIKCWESGPIAFTFVMREKSWQLGCFFVFVPFQQCHCCRCGSGKRGKRPLHPHISSLSSQPLDPYTPTVPCHYCSFRLDLVIEPAPTSDWPQPSWPWTHVPQPLHVVALMASCNHCSLGPSKRPTPLSSASSKLFRLSSLTPYFWIPSR